jgi:hypothetical protein
MCMQMLEEISEVPSAIREVVKKKNPFSRALPYTILDKCPRLSSAIPSLHKRDEEEDNKIIAFLDRGRQGETDFWNPNTPFSYDSEQPKTLASKGYYCIALSFALEKTETHHRILRRFDTLAVFDFTNVDRTAKSISMDLMEAGIHPEKSLKQLLKGITNCINAGCRYKELSEKLGGVGSLFVIPTNQQL